MRVTTAFNRLLCLPGAAVSDVSFSVDGVIVCVRLRRRRRVCARCGQTGQRLVIHDRRVKRWRHLDLGATRCIIECELRLLRCPDCRVVRAEPVPWARPGAHHTRDFEDVVAWLAQQMAKTPIAGLLRVGWDTVGRIVERVVSATTPEPVFVFADDGLNVFPSLDDLRGWIEAPDVKDGVYEAIFTLLGEVIGAVAEGTNVILTVTELVDPEGLQQRLRAHAHQFVSDPEDLRAVANEMLRREWDVRWPKRPRWLSRRLHGGGPPKV